MKTVLTSKSFLIIAFFVAFFYFVISIYLPNIALVKQTLLGGFGINYKVSILISLFMGAGSAISVSNLLTLITISILSGVNIALFFKRFGVVKSSGKLTFVVGGGSLLSVAGSGCISCGLPILGILGFGGSLAYLPFRGLELSVLAILLLGISFWMILKDQKTCKLSA